MSDLSTREQIRAEAIERLAQATHWRNEYMCLPDDPPEDHWEIADEDVRASCRDHVAFLVDALGDLLPTEICCAAVSRDYNDFENLDHEVLTTPAEAAKELASWGGDGRLVGYYRTDWIEVSE